MRAALVACTDIFYCRAGVGQAANSQCGPVRPTKLPSGHCL